MRSASSSSSSWRQRARRLRGPDRKPVAPGAMRRGQQDRRASVVRRVERTWCVADVHAREHDGRKGQGSERERSRRRGIHGVSLGQRCRASRAHTRHARTLRQGGSDLFQKASLLKSRFGGACRHRPTTSMGWRAGLIAAFWLCGHPSVTTTLRAGIALCASAHSRFQVSLVAHSSQAQVLTAVPPRMAGPDRPIWLTRVITQREGRGGRGCCWVWRRTEDGAQHDDELHCEHPLQL